MLALDAQAIAMRYELEHKRRGFSLLAELSVSLRGAESLDKLFELTTKRINSALNMHKTALFLKNGDGDFFPFILQGFTEAEKNKLMGRSFNFDESLLDVKKPLILSSEGGESPLKVIRKALNLPYFISTPVAAKKEVSALLVAGRMVEAPPFFSRLSENEGETIQGIAALLGSILVHQKLEEAYKLAGTDGLTGLLNRRTMEIRVQALLNSPREENDSAAFIIIDLDHFKNVNDLHGHLTGDWVLKTLARTLRGTFRSSDLVARFGGDEFIVFCPAVGKADPLLSRVKELVVEWNKAILYNEDEEPFHSSLSVGISMAPKDGATYGELLRKADIALYETKRKGRNGYTIYDESTMKKAPRWRPS